MHINDHQSTARDHIGDPVQNLDIQSIDCNGTTDCGSGGSADVDNLEVSVIRHVGQRANYGDGLGRAWRVDPANADRRPWIADIDNSKAQTAIGHVGQVPDYSDGVGPARCIESANNDWTSRIADIHDLQSRRAAGDISKIPGNRSEEPPSE